MNHHRQLQLSLFNDEKQDYFSGREIGTFKDSLRAPIFRWFKYPAGYSYKFVDEAFEIFQVQQGDWVYDPFSGTGTTLLCAKKQGVHAYGVEAHSFVHWVADVKLFWEFEAEDLSLMTQQFLKELTKYIEIHQKTATVEGIFPELIYKCYHPNDLIELYLIREYINMLEDNPFRNVMKLALTDALRSAAVAGTGWPYISPKKSPEKYPPKKALNVFSKTFMQMISDIHTVLCTRTPAKIINKLGDSRQKQELDDEQVKLAITSPPYLNNYDYADRTRLETYFWGITSTWADITKQFRNKLMVAATTQIKRSEFDVETVLNKNIENIDPKLYSQLQEAIIELSHRRLHKGGKKDYDLMTALYFNDILKMLTETHRVLMDGGHFCLVLGDSAPYGVHIPTDDYIGRLALGLGFSDYFYFELRKRGTKWKANPQRHSVPLREGIVVLKK